MPNPYHDPKTGRFTFKKAGGGVKGVTGQHSFSRFAPGSSAKHHVVYAQPMGGWMVDDPAGRKPARDSKGVPSVYKTEKAAQKRADAIEAGLSELGGPKYSGRPKRGVPVGGNFLFQSPIKRR